ncbi:MAG: hypothetical protein QXJ20_02595 [Candidatus Aenigmatarchaeota archaeon]
MVEGLKRNKKIHKERAAAQTAKLLPYEHLDYFKKINSQHFGEQKEAVGSFFVKVPDLESLLTLAYTQRGTLKGDDRGKIKKLMKKAGLSQEEIEKAFLPECRYLLVKTEGRIGMIRVDQLDPNTEIKIKRLKEGVPASLIVEVESSKDFPFVNYGVIIIGPNEKEKPEDPEPSTKEMVWTAHPGFPIKPAKGDIKEWEGRDSVSVKEVIEKLGKNVYIKLEVKRKETS